MIWIRIIFIMMILSLLMMLYAFIERYWIKVKSYSIKIQKNAFNGLKIIFLTDFHHSPFVSKRFIRKIVRKVNQLKPDLIILGGDYVSDSKKYIKPLFAELRKLKAKIGVYGVIGNHDFDVDKQSVLNEMKEANIISLDNSSYWIKQKDDQIKLGGVADFLYDQPDLSPTLKDTNKDDFIIVCSHNPDYFDVVKGKIDLMLSGHNHGGQITVFGFYAPYLPTKNKIYRTGMKIEGRSKLIISNGLGTVGLPFRFFARPQIVLIEFKA